MLACRLQALQAIVGSEHRIVGAEDGREEKAQVGIVLDDEKRGALSMVRLNVVWSSTLLSIGEHKRRVGVVDEVGVGVVVVVEHIVDKSEHALAIAPHHIEQSVSPL